MIPTLQLGQLGRPLPPRASLPLDAYTSNLWGLFGITKLLSGYTGSAMRVRRSSDDTEQDIGFSGTALDTTALVAFAGAGSAFVTKLYDQSGSGHNFVQATNSKQPRIVNAGSYDGFLFFDGTDDYMSAANSTAGSALTFATKFLFRVSLANQALLSQSNTNTAAHVAMAVQEQNDGGGDKMHAYTFGSVSPDYLELGYTTLPTTLATEMYAFNRALVGTSRIVRYRNGSSVSISTSHDGGTGNFTSETFSIGDPAGSPSAPPRLDLYNLAIWSSDQSANAAAIHTAIN